MKDLLTWEGVRALARVEVLNLRQQFALAEMDRTRPPIKWFQQRHFFKTATPATVQRGDLLYARTAWRHPWRTQLIQAVTEPCVLVSCFYDPTIKQVAIEEMFAPGSPVRHWFGVQAMTTHPQLTAMPVGVEGSIAPRLQTMPQDPARPIQLYLNFQVRHSSREVLWRHFSAFPWVTSQRWSSISDDAYVAQLGRSRFVLSPPGLGWDCYRTYEAIAMGAIPIVLRKRPITDVCEALPVLLVDDWREVTQERLAREWATMDRTNTQTVTMTYWRQRIQQTAQAVREQ